MDVPTATYRIQFNPDFGFQDCLQILDYLQHMGVSHIYASPVFQARPGSNHGYDVTDPNRLNPQLGNLEQFLELRDAMDARGMGWIQDVIPNHMAYCQENPMIMDLWENGLQSSFFEHFDIQWDYPYEGIRERVLAPFLGNSYGETLENGELNLQYDERGFRIRYHDLEFPLRIESYHRILTHGLSELKKELGRKHPDYISILGLLYVLQTLPSREDVQEHHDQVAFVKGMLWDLYTRNAAIGSFLDENLRTFNGTGGDPESFEHLDRLLLDQHFRLSFWKVATEEINYRRFFSINDLICLRVEDQNVRDHTHSLVFDLVRRGLVSGLRIDHVDGLYDPMAYLSHIRYHAPQSFVVVEKILDMNETLPPSWPVQGTTGYDFLNHLNQLFCMESNRTPFTKIYREFSGLRAPFSQLVQDTKRMIIEKDMGGDVDNLALLAKGASGRDRHGRDITLIGLRRALVEILICFPVYRTYKRGGGSDEREDRIISEAVACAVQSKPAMLKELRFIERFMRMEFPDYVREEEREQWTRFVMRFQQFTGPLMAKGFEDTLLYSYNRLLSLNEVGGAPDRFGISPETFHRFLERLQKQWPHSLNATSTHDTKRGEDVRARINVLSELPAEWERKLRKWRRINRKEKTRVGNLMVPDRNDEYFLYQTLLGSFPFFEDEQERYLDRIREYVVKAVREAKIHTGWLQPDTAYEKGYVRFAERILRPGPDNSFLGDFVPFLRKVAHFGVINSLAQVLVRTSAPGVPDMYQGTELWDLHLVDPDNRRPVDFQKRGDFLDEIRRGCEQNLPGLIERLCQSPWDGKIKLFLLYRAMAARRQNSDLFQNGTHIPITADGPFQNHLVAFAREHQGQWAVTVVPRFATFLVDEGEFPLGKRAWKETRLRFPAAAPTSWRDAITEDVLEMREKGVYAGDILRYFPVSLLIGSGQS